MSATLTIDLSEMNARMDRIEAKIDAVLRNEAALWKPMRQRQAAAWLEWNPATLSMATHRDENPAPHLMLGSEPRYFAAQLLAWMAGQPVPEMPRVLPFPVSTASAA